MNVDESVVKIVVEVLAGLKERAGSESSLVQLINYVDYKNHCIATFEEVQSGLNRVEGIFVLKREERLYFSGSSPVAEASVQSAESMSQSDWRLAYDEYSRASTT